ncbi:MAG: hypothetical protein IJ680_03535 [Paludibacteraceae bacterium]|nr:hypothetical protein [Paludibacteraceae bacterium]
MMKRKMRIVCMLLASSLMFIACSEKDEATDSNVILKPARRADYVIYSGSHTHRSSFGVQQKAPADFQYHKVYDNNIPEAYKALIPTAVTQEERTYVMNYIKDHPTEGFRIFDCQNYFVQSLGSSYVYYTGNTLVDNNGAQHGVTGGNQMDYLVINGQHINDYNASWGPDALCLNLPLVDPTYHDSYGDTDNTKHDAWCVYAIPGYGYYLGFDYRTRKTSGEYYDGDGVYNDWVIKLTPADGSQPTAPSTDDTYQPGEGEVEANLSINAEKEADDYIATKLSVHVRDTTDVEVFISVPMSFYCAADDMNIVLSNPQGIMQYNDYVETVSMQINGNTVSLNISYEENGIRVSTRGVNAQVLNYCRENYQDGITFEVWNYYRDTTRTILQEMLNQTSITFLSGLPGRYVNAFGAVDDQPNPLDCTVLPSSEYALSGQERFNQIYTRQ